MYWVLSYDVTDNRRRRRLRKRLHRYLTPVQRSVFEGRMGPEEVAAVEALILRELDLEEDSVRMYPMTRGCWGLVRSWGVAPPLPTPDAPLLL